MKFTKATVFTVLIAGSVVACASALAQDSTTAPTPALSTNSPSATPHAKFHGASVDQVMQRLNLTDDEKAQVRSVLESEHQKMRDLHNDTSLSADDRRSQMKEIRKDTAAQLQSILTPDQFAQWKSMNHGHHGMSHATQTISTNAPAGS